MYLQFSKIIWIKLHVFPFNKSEKKFKNKFTCLSYKSKLVPRVINSLNNSLTAFSIALPNEMCDCLYFMTVRLFKFWLANLITMIILQLLTDNITTLENKFIQI